MPGEFPPGFAPAASDAMAYLDEFGYDGGDPNIIRPNEVSTLYQESRFWDGRVDLRAA